MNLIMRQSAFNVQEIGGVFLLKKLNYIRNYTIVVWIERYNYHDGRKWKL